MIRLAAGVAAAAIIIAVSSVLLAPMRAFAAEPCPGQIVVASYYGAESGNRTASGLRFDGSQMIAAHRTMPFGTKLRVSYRGRSVVMTVQDRGPFVAGRGIDLSRAAAATIGMIEAGVVRGCVEGHRPSI